MKTAETYVGVARLSRELIAGGRQSPVAKTAELARGPLRGAAITLAYAAGVPFVRNNEEYQRYFEGSQRREIQEKTFEDLPAVIDALNARVGGTETRMPCVPKKLYDQWEQAKQSLQEEIGESNQLTDYVLIGGNGERVMFYISGGRRLSPLIINSGEVDIDAIYNQIDNNMSVPLRTLSPINNEDINRPRPLIESSLIVEQGISKLQSQMAYASGRDTTPDRIDRISRVTNRVDLRRHTDFSFEGTLVENLTNAGVSSIGELQRVGAVLTETMRYDTQAEKAVYDRDLGESWKKIYNESFVQETKEQEVTSQEALDRLARESVYFRLVKQFFQENPTIIDIFIKSGLYVQFAEEFKDKFLASYGQTERSVAEAMIANYFLFRFEGHKDSKDSASQEQLGAVADFHATIGAFVDANRFCAPPVPEVTDIAVDQQNALASLGSRIGQIPQPVYKIPASEKVAVISAAEDALMQATHQRRRFTTGRLLMDKLENRMPLISDNGNPPTALAEVIGNLLMARVPGENRFTASSTLEVKGYLPVGLSEPQPFDSVEAAPFTTIEDSMRYIFNGSRVAESKGNVSDGEYVTSASDTVYSLEDTFAVESHYESQVGRLFEQAPVIFDFLMHDPRVPDNVRDFMSRVGSDELPVRLLDQFEGLDTGDPLIINKFYQGGISKYQTMLKHRYVTDFVRGVETELINLTQTMPKRLKRKTAPIWENYDFSAVTDAVLEEAISRTLEFGEHRINKLDNKKDDQRYMKDIQEDLEAAVLWDTFGMKYLRWRNRMTADSYLGYGWHCGCFYRKTIFNNTIPQY